MWSHLLSKRPGPAAIGWTLSPGWEIQLDLGCLLPLGLPYCNKEDSRSRAAARLCPGNSLHLTSGGSPYPRRCRPRWRWRRKQVGKSSLAGDPGSGIPVEAPDITDPSRNQTRASLLAALPEPLAAAPWWLFSRFSERFADGADGRSASPPVGVSGRAETQKSHRLLGPSPPARVSW